MRTARFLTLGAALRYRGGTQMWAWALHRLTGLGVLAFLILHVVDTALVIYRPDLYDAMLATYRHPIFRVGEYLIFLSVLYHAANGLRIVVQDFWTPLMRHRKALLAASTAVVVAAALPIAWVMLGPVLGLREEPGAARHRERCLREPTAPACVAPTAKARTASPETGR